MEDKIDQKSVMEYLQKNNLFSKSWFVQNAPKEFIQDWFKHRREPIATKNKSKTEPLNDNQINNGTTEIFNSVSNVLLEETISCAEEQQLTSSYAQIAKGGRNSVTLELFHDILTRKTTKKSKEPLTRDQLKQRFEGMDENQLFMELITDITNELDMDTLCHKILVNVCILTNSDRASLFLAKGSRDNRYLSAKLFDVTPECLLEDALTAAVEYTKIPPLPFGTGIVGHVALSKQNVNIEDAYEDPRFNKDIDTRTGYHTKSLMSQPILNFCGDVIGVAECINKLTDVSKFSLEDEVVFQKYLTFCGIGIQNAQLFEMSVLEYKRNQLLLSLAKTIFEDTSSMDIIINKIMSKTKGILDSDKCRVYLVEDKKTEETNELFKTIWQLDSERNEVEKLSLEEVNEQNDFYIKFANQVVSDGKTLNHNHISSDLEEQLELNGGFYSDSILSVPIQNNSSKVIGVAQLIKSDQKKSFSEIDIVTLEAFSIFCGLGIHNCMIYEEAIKLNARQNVALEVLSYHASSSIDETVEFMNSPIKNADLYKIYSYHFDDLQLTDQETCQATIKMFIEMNFLVHFKIPYSVLCRWVLSIKKNYRPVLYHNWRHALNVTQSMFIMLTTYDLKSIMSLNEQLALLIASMCHDLDHRGTNNSFQAKSGSPLATLYSSSIMENHHFYHCLLILNAEGNNILKSLSEFDYRDVLKIIENCILSTDLEQYFKKKDKFEEYVHAGEKEFNNANQRDLLRGMLMTACDLSAICKPWRIQKRVAEMVASEFFEQGDLEKSMQQTPIAMMDRERKGDLPAMQVGFIDHIGYPLYKILFEFWPKLEPFYQGCVENREKWQSLVRK